MMAAKVISTIVQNTAAMMAGRLISRVFQFFLLIYAARELGAADFGIFSWAFALTGLVAVFMDPGLSRYSVQQLARSQKEIPLYFGGNLVIKIVLVLAGLLALFIISYAMGRGQQAIQAALLLGAMAGVDSLGRCFLMVFQAAQRMDYEALAISAAGVLFTLIGLLALYLMPNLAVLCGAFLLGGLIRLGISIGIYRGRYPKPTYSFNFQFLTKLLKNGFPFALTTVFVTVYYYIDTIILTAYASDQAIGYYGAAYRFVEAPLFLVASLTTALFPAASRLYGKDKEHLREVVGQIFPKMMALGLSVALVISFLAEDLVALFFGEQYGPAAKVLPVLIFSGAIIMPSTVLGTTIRAINRQGISALVTGLAAVLNIVLNLIFIPRYTIMGAAWTTLATEAFVIVVYFAMVRHYIGRILPWGAVLSVLLFGAGLGACLYLTQAWNLWLRLATVSLLWVPLLLFTGIIEKKHLIEMFKAVLPAGR